ncbi:MAG: alpha/beta hydrolase [Candidatus Xenobia bacterium]
MHWFMEMGGALLRRLRTRLTRVPAVPDPRPVVGEDVKGDVRLHEAFPSRVLGGSRDIVVYLPPGYDACRDRFPVLYVQDGQNLFDRRTAFSEKWDLDGAAERLIRGGHLRRLIIVGIYNSPYRMSEYTPVPDDEHPEGGDADRYGRFLVDEVKPFIDRRYRTLDGPEDTGIMGSSLGGLVSLYLAFKYPRVFGLCGAVSPSLWWGDEYFTHWLAEDSSRRGPRRVWLCMGTEEGDKDESGVAFAIHRTRELRRLLLARGYRAGQTLFYREVAGGGHHEHAWRARSPEILLALFGNTPEQQWVAA